MYCHACTELSSSVIQLTQCTPQCLHGNIVITFLATRMGSKTFVGQFPEFNSQTDSFKSYVERAKFFFEANSIAEGKQLAVFLSSIGGKTKLWKT